MRPLIRPSGRSRTTTLPIRKRASSVVSTGSSARVSRVMRTLPERGGDVPAIDGSDAGGGLQRQRLVQKGLGHILGRHFLAQQVAAHIVLLGKSARRRALGD